MAQPFELNFKKNGIVDVDALNGFTNALLQLQEYITEKTEFDPEKRYIDSVELLNKITATAPLMQKLLMEAANDLDKQYSRILTPLV